MEKKKEVGVVWDKLNNTDKKFKLKKIEKKISNIRLDEKIIKFINWFSIYNLVPKGMILKMCLGNLKNFDEVKQKKKIKIKIKKIKYLLNTEQNKALSSLESSGSKFNVSVLLGVTGSGKTLVYFERIKKLVQENKQALILIPEIFLTTQFKNRFKLFFGYVPAIWHSKISLNKKKDIWQTVANNKVKIVLGARSSLVLPFKNLGLIIVDEEHDSSYKQEESVIYNARDMAISRASIENIPIHFHQKNALETGFETNSFDFITSSFFFHEVSVKDTKTILNECYRILKPGGLMLHMELPPCDQTDPYYNFYLDWDAFYNNEPHYLKFRELDFEKLVTQSGFDKKKLLFTRIPNFPSTPFDDFVSSILNNGTLSRDHGNGAVWYTFGGWK